MATTQTVSEILKTTGLPQLSTATTLTTELTEEELQELEQKAREYYNDRVLEVKVSRKAKGISEELTGEDIELLQSQAAFRLEKLTKEYRREKRARERRLRVQAYILDIPEIIKPEIKAPERAENFTRKQYLEMAMPILNELVDKENPGRTFQMKEGIEFILKMLCCYWACDDGFYWFANQRMGDNPVIIAGKPHLDKGLGFLGLNGVGKTLFLEAFECNPRLSYETIKAKELTRLFDKDGLEGISKYQFPIKGNDSHYGQSQIGLAIDDIKSEATGFHYKSCEVVEEVMYNRWESLPGHFTHFATNHKLSELESRYGTRFTDRLIGRTNFIRFPRIPSFRI